MYANSLWCTNSRRIAFGCSPNVRHAAECCLPRLRNTSTLNVRIIFECRGRIRIMFAFRCTRGFTLTPPLIHTQNNLLAKFCQSKNSWPSATLHYSVQTMSKFSGKIRNSGAYAQTPSKFQKNYKNSKERMSKPCPIFCKNYQNSKLGSICPDPV